MNTPVITPEGMTEQELKYARENIAAGCLPFLTTAPMFEDSFKWAKAALATIAAQSETIARLTQQLADTCARERSHMSATDTANASRMEWFKKAEALTAENARLTAIEAALTCEKDGAYFERNQLVALLARVFPSGIKRTAIDGWEPEWHGCVYIDFPTGQGSWHYHDDHENLFRDLPPYKGEWDGHTTDQKYDRVWRLVRRYRIEGER